LIKTCIALANGVGGRIVVGVKDSILEICGISEKIRKRVYDEFPNNLYDSTRPRNPSGSENSELIRFLK